MDFFCWIFKIFFIFFYRNHIFFVNILNWKKSILVDSIFLLIF